MSAKLRPAVFGIITPPHLASPTRVELESALATMLGGLEVGGGSFVVDLGCGSGEYRHLFLCRPYLGLDLEDREFASKLGPGVTFALADAHRLPLSDGCAGLVLCAYAFDRFADPEAAMDEIARVLAPGGVALLALPTAAVKAFDLPLRALQGLGMLRGVELSGQTNLNYYRPGGLARLAERHGLTLERSTALGGPFLYPLKLTWLWWRLARYCALSAWIALLKRLRGAPLPRSYRKRHGVSVLPRRSTRHARDTDEFLERLDAAMASAGLLTGLRTEFGCLLAALDRRLFPKVGSEYCYLLRKAHDRT